MPRMAVGSWAWVFGPYAAHPVPLREVARTVATLGYDGLELTGRPHAHPDDFPTAEQRREVTRLLAAEGLAVASLGGPVGGGSPLGVEPAQYLASVRRYLEFCVDAGIDALRVSSGRPTGQSEEECFKRLIEVWNAAAEAAAAAGVRLLWEFEPNQFASRPREVRRVLDGVHQPTFQVIFDLSHASIVAVAQPGLPDGVPGFIRLLGRRIGRLHLSDTEGVVDARGGSVRRQLGDGAVDFDAAVTALDEAGAGDGWWTLDLHGEADATGTARSAKAFMDALARRHPERR